jgi:hypothetical protein
MSKQDYKHSLGNTLDRISQVTGVDGLRDIYTSAYESARERRVADNEVAQVISESSPMRTSSSKHLNGQSCKKRSQKKVRKSNLRLLSKLKSRVKEIIGYDAKPKFISADLWYDCAVILWDKSAKAIKEFSVQCQNKIAISRLNRAALGICDENGKRAYSYVGDSRGALRARRIFALGWLLMNLSVGTRRKGPFNRLVAGIPQSALRAVLRDPSTGEQVHRTTISGEHRSTRQAGEIGYLDALKESGFCYTRQAKWQGDAPNIKGWEDIRDVERAGQNGEWQFSMARYWIITSRFSDSADETIRSRLWIDYIAGCQPLDRWLDDSTVPILADVHGKTSDILPVKPPG